MTPSLNDRRLLGNWAADCADRVLTLCEAKAASDARPREVSRTFPEGTGKVELVAIYEVRDGRIATARFISGQKTLDPQ